MASHPRAARWCVAVLRFIGWRTGYEMSEQGRHSMNTTDSDTTRKTAHSLPNKRMQAKSAIDR